MDRSHRAAAAQLPFVLSLSIALLTACTEDPNGPASRAQRLAGKLTADDALDLTRYSLGTVAVLSGSDTQALFGAKDQQNPDLANITNSPATTGSDDLSIAAITERVTPCPGGGTITYIQDNQDPPSFSQGDSYTTTFAGCVSGTTTTNGSRIFRVDLLEGQPYVTAPWAMTTSMTRENFTVVSLWGEHSVDGVSTIALSSADNIVYTQVTTGDWARTRNNGGTTTMSTNNYTISNTWDENLRTFTLEFDVASTSDQFGDVHVHTQEPLSGTIFQTPASGRFTIERTGIDGSLSIVTVTALPNGLVRMEIDNNGDGVVDTVQEVSWYQIGVERYLFQYF